MRYLTISLLGLLLLVAGALFYLKNSREDRKVHNLKIEKSFPDKDDEFFLQYPNMFYRDKEGNLFINDQPQSHILKINSDGTFITSIGNRGKGPGEFIEQSYFAYGNHKLYVWDQGNQRLQIVSSEGKYLNSVFIKNNLSSFIYHRGKVYAFTFNRNPINFKREGLISVFDTLGNRVQEFGNYLKLVDKMPPAANKLILKFYNNKLYVLFHFYPILQIYNEQGKLLKTINFEKEDYKSFVPQNYDPKSFSTPGISATKYLFRAMDINKEGIFLGLYKPYLAIDQYDFNGNFKYRYEYKNVYNNYYLFDFKVGKTKNKKIHFVVLNRNKLPYITVYSASR